jgi:hypothetical protein
MNLKQAIARIAELEAEIARLSPKASPTESPTYAASLNDGRPYIPASAGGIRQPWESLWREVQTALHGGITPRITGLPNKTVGAGIKDLSFPYSIRERAALVKLREVFASLSGDLRDKCQAAFTEAGESPDIPTGIGLPVYTPKGKW